MRQLWGTCRAPSLACGAPLVPHGVPAPGSPLPGWVPVVVWTPRFWVGVMPAGPWPWQWGCPWPWGGGARQGMFRREAGLPHGLEFSLGTLFVALGQGWLSWWAPPAMGLRHGAVLGVMLGCCAMGLCRGRACDVCSCWGGSWHGLCRGAVLWVMLWAVCCGQAVALCRGLCHGFMLWGRAVPEQIVGPMAVSSSLSPPGHAALPPILLSCYLSILLSHHSPALLSVLPHIPLSSRPGALVPQPRYGRAEQGLTHLFALSLSVRLSVFLSAGRLHCPFIKTADSGPPSSSSSSSPPRTPFPYITCHRTPNLSSFFPCR